MNARMLGWGIIALVVILAAGWLYQEPIQQKWRQYTGPELSLQGVQVPLVQPVPARVASAPRAHVPASAPAPAIQASVLATGDIHQAQVASQPKTHTVKTAGETLSKIGERFGYDWRGLCAYNDLSNCHVITIGQVIKLGTVHKTKPQIATVSPKAPKPKAKRVVTTPVAQEQSCVKLGVAPFNRYGSMKLRLQGIDLNPELTPEEKEEAKRLVQAGHGERMLVTNDMVFQSMPFRSKDGKVKFLKNVKVCMPEQGGRPEAIEVWRLSTERFVGDLPTCGNIGPVLIPQKPEEPVTPPPPPPAASAPPVTPTPDEPQVPKAEPEEPEAAVIEDDWDLGFFAGGDKDTRYGGGEGAYYPFLKYAQWGRYALGVGGSFSLWEGGTSDGYVYGGRTGAFGLAQKFSFNNRRDLGIKFPMIGGLWERGHDASNKYQQRRFTELLCASVSYTDASREKDGKTVLPEWQIWGSYCNALNQSKSHSWEGKALDSSLLPDNQYVLGIGGRVFLSKNLGDEGLAAKLQPFAELGANKTAPNDPSGHAYVGLRTVNKVWGCGAGLHFADVGRTPGATCTYDAGRHYKLHVQEERWNAMIKAVEALGVATD